MTLDAAPQAAAAFFAECYDRPPAGVWHAPGRANLIGEHTDYNDGFVLPFALSQGVMAAAGPRPDATLEVRSRQAEGTAAIRLDALAPGAVMGWAAYPAGVAWALREAGYPVSGASVAIDGDIPDGAGLSSSAALGCAVGLALTGLQGRGMPAADLVSIISAAENDFVGVPTGTMDQSASLLCEAGHALMLDCRSGASDAVPLDLQGARLVAMVIDTGTRRALADGRYAARRGECEEAARLLGARALRDVTGEQAGLAGIPDPLLRGRARHVTTENARVLEAVALLRARAPADCGPLLTESHRSLRDDFEVSWAEADAAVEAALAAGALGARMIGGGFAGSVLALLPALGRAQVRSGVAAVFRRRGWDAPRFLDAVPSAGARRVA